METVFITIHGEPSLIYPGKPLPLKGSISDLSLDARIRYVSDSVEDILGYLPHEVRGKSCWEYFHPDQIPFARASHGRGIQLDKAAVLNYCQIKHRDGSWIGCECVFTIVYDVLIATTSIYRRGPRSRQRALDAPGIRRVFSSSPRDPRYHMLSYISNKFYQEPRTHAHEPRAALFLNRFTRTSTIMYATDSVSNIFGIPANQLIGKSFYFCIAENCLKDAVQCLESAKANDSIAYLRFWYRDPTQDDQRALDASMPDLSSDEDDHDEGGVRIKTTQSPEAQPAIPSIESAIQVSPDRPEPQPRVNGDKSRCSSGNSTDLDGNPHDTIFDLPVERSSASSMTAAEDDQPIEVEAVVSCTSDGLVVVLRQARPAMPHLDGTAKFAKGLFASPWATDPVMPPDAEHVEVPHAATTPGMEPEPTDFLKSIREVAVFAWSLTGINGSLAQYGRGTPIGEALPAGGLPVWDPNCKETDGDQFNGFMSGSHRPVEGIEKVLGRKEEDLTSSDDEVLWKRVPQIPAYRKPKRRVHQDAFGSEKGEERPRKRNTEAGGVRIGDGSISPMKVDTDDHVEGAV